MTSTTGRVSDAHKTMDESPSELAHIVELCSRHLEESTSTVRLEAVIHGVRVALVTNSVHLADLFRDNWFSVEQWEGSTTNPAPSSISITVNAAIDAPGMGPCAYYSRERNELWFFNISFYGQIKSWLLGAVGRLLADEEEVHSIHGACVDLGEPGALLIIAPSGTGKSASTYGLAGRPGARFHSDDWVFVRYGSKRNPVASAYISEREFYLRTNHVATYPESVVTFLNCDVENVPPPTEDVLDKYGDLGRQLALKVPANGEPVPEDLWMDLARLVAFDNARAMLPGSSLFPGGELVRDPLEGVRVSAIVLLERDPTSDVVVERLDESDFIGRVMVGRTPASDFHTAYNAYRLVDDAAERAFIEQHSDDFQHLVDAMVSAEAPATLRQEAMMFRTMARSAPTFRVNTILTRAGRLSIDAAVQETLGLLEKLVTEDAPDLLKLDDVPSQIGL